MRLKHLVVLTFRHGCHELGTQTSKDEQDLYEDITGKLAYRVRPLSSVMSTSMAMCPSRVLNHYYQLRRIIDLVGAYFRIKDV